MKKIIISLSILFCVGTIVSAQETTLNEQAQTTSERSKGTVNKAGQYILPVAGDYALGVSISTPLQSIFSDAADGIKFEGYQENIYGKYFLSDNRAIRAGISLNIGTDKTKSFVTNIAETTTNPLNIYATTVDITKVKTTNVGLFAGYEFRRGYGRLQAFYGPELAVGFNKVVKEYTYGNPLSELNQGERTTKESQATDITCSLGGFIGVEYFIAPKISIGGELNLGFGIETLGQIEMEKERYNSVTGEIETYSYREKTTVGPENTFLLQTNSTGNIFMMFYF